LSPPIASAPNVCERVMRANGARAIIRL
jgi:hypothetical protein